MGLLILVFGLYWFETLPCKATVLYTVLSFLQKDYIGYNIGPGVLLKCGLW